MFFATHICWVSYGTIRARYCLDPRDVRGAKPKHKKCSLGNEMRLTASLRRFEFSWPRKSRQHVTPLIAIEIRWFKSPKLGVGSLSVHKQISESFVVQNHTLTCIHCSPRFLSEKLFEYPNNSRNTRT